MKDLTFVFLTIYNFSPGEDGPSQMALEDLAMFRAINNCTVFYPSDAVSCERAVEICANTPNMCYIRTSRPATAVLYSADEPFEAGKGKVNLRLISRICQCNQRNIILTYY